MDIFAEVGDVPNLEKINCFDSLFCHKTPSFVPRLSKIGNLSCSTHAWLSHRHNLNCFCMKMFVTFYVLSFLELIKLKTEE